MHTDRKTAASTNNCTFDNFLTSRSSPIPRLNHGFGNTFSLHRRDCTRDQISRAVEIHLLIRVDQEKACWNGLSDEV